MRSLLFILVWVVTNTIQVVFATELDSYDPRFSEIRDGTVIPYFETLQKGEVESIRQYLTTRRYAANRTLIEQNELYPDYLRGQFRGAMFELVRLIIEGDEVTALVRIYWPDGRSAQTILGLIVESPTSTSDSNIRWKIDRD